MVSNVETIYLYFITYGYIGTQKPLNQIYRKSQRLFLDMSEKFRE